MCGSQGIFADAMLRTITLIYSRLRQAGIPGGLAAVLEVLEDDADSARQLLEQTMIDGL
jgi:hypothetical protein